METERHFLRLVLMIIICGVAATGFACTSAEFPTANREAVLNDPNETVNINTASLEELTRIPFIGEKLAAAIVTHRETHGRFRRPEDLLLLDGISDRRFREIRHLIRTD